MSCDDACFEGVVAGFVRGFRSTVMTRMAAFVLMAVALVGQAAFAQSDSRNRFPGRRVGGGTRGVCTSRLIAHLTPINNIKRVAQAAPVRLAVLQGPTSQPFPLEISLEGRPSIQLPASPAGVVVLSIPPVRSDTRWQSSYVCPAATPEGDDPLNFVVAVAPPALSLLRPTSGAGDQLPGLLSRCGGTIELAQIRQWLGVEALPGQWPQQLPVRCEGG